MRPGSFLLLMLLAVGGCNGCPSPACGPGGRACEDAPASAPASAPGRHEDPAEKHTKPEPKDDPAKKSARKEEPHH